MANGNNRAKLRRKAEEIKQVVSPTTSLPPVADVDHDGLLDDLLAQIDGKPGSQLEAAKVISSVEANDRVEKAKKDPRKKFLERQAKKAAALAASQGPDDPESSAQLAREKVEEERAVKTTCDALGLEMYEINADGHCMYSAIADQLSLLQIIPPQAANFKTTRTAAADYMMRHEADFLPFLPSLSGEDGPGATSGGLMTSRGFAEYCNRVRNTGTWGGEPEIMALAKVFNVPIHVIQWGQPPIVCHSPDGSQVDPKVRSVKISYHRRMYGLGEHYNSLRPKRNVLQSMIGALNGS